MAYHTARGRLGRTTISRRRWLAATAATIGATGLGSHFAFAQEATPVASPVDTSRNWRSEHWVGTWAASPHAPGLGFQQIPSQLFEFANQTVRQIAHTSIGGAQIRVRLANTFGDTPLLIGGARIALRDAEARIDLASDRELTFSGSPVVTIPAGALALSDPIELTVPALSDVVVSIYLPEPTSTTTVHGAAFQTNYISPEGDFTAEPDMPVDSTVQTWIFLSGIDVAVSEPAGAIVALGDSLTDGVLSTPETNQRWPDLLAARLAADANQPALGVLNQGIGGNRVLRDGPPDLGFGQSALARFDRDVLGQAGVTHLIVFEGINDIILPIFAGEAGSVSAGEIIAGLRQLVERAHERGIVVFGATLTPFGASEAFFTTETEAIRQAVNTWIRDGGAFDAVLDFEAAVRDPENPERLLAEFDGGDGLHLNDAGFHAIADSIDLDLFRQ